MTRPRDDLAGLAMLAALRLLGTWATVRGGVVALSDDDYARAAIAERFASAPKLDPSGTSWLPLPFWIHGEAMRLFGSSLATARATSAVLAVVAIWLVYAGGRAAGLGTRRSFWGAAWAAIVPPSLILGSVAVPELPTAALSAFALLATTRTTSRNALFAGLAMLSATLSRYEAWPIALVVALFALRDAPRTIPRIAGALLALAGPLAWIAWNRHAHGDPLHFLARVSSYRAALGVPAGAWAPYAEGILAGCLTVTLPLAIVALLARRDAPRALERWKRPAAGVAALVLFLVAGSLVGGAPTHHPERTLLAAWLVAAVAQIDLQHAVRFPPLHARGAAGTAAVLGFAALVAIGVLHDARQTLGEPFERHGEERIGLALRAVVPPGERVLVATDDYGYFAVGAAFGRPADVAVDRTHDPRAGAESSSLASAETLRARLAAERAQYVVAKRPVPIDGRERAREGDWRVIAVEK